ncbi:ABC transporter substrate-binding protein [Caproiciproducens sp.]|uniref:ABC transporter substrate-binding protein n=1 Tax=Caproiciproducens sp. TaxID=1954376 RepID=UPI00289823E5|nr:ABC transporter substrate-binding protein [Caproiciproducens sp.]
MKRVIAAILTVCIASLALGGCAGATTEKTTPAATQSKAEAVSKAGNKKLTVGFAQIGQESGWRDAETASIQFYAGQHVDTIDFKFADAQQKQENQIKAIKSFIEMGVDVIGLAPVVETGWDAVFTEAKDAGIPIVLVDRKAKVSDDLYSTFIGSDFITEGQNAADELAKLLNNKGNVVELEGTVGASAANDRKKGFDDQLAAKYPDMKVIASQTGDFTRAKGKEVMESFLKTYGNKINAVYAHNDDMMLGAIEAMKEAGMKPGKDIKTVSCDGVKGIFQAMVDGEANVTVECNPLLGPQFFETCQKLKAGESVEKWIKSQESVFRADTAAKDLPTRVY